MARLAWGSGGSQSARPPRNARIDHPKPARPVHPRASVEEVAQGAPRVPGLQVISLAELDPGVGEAEAEPGLGRLRPDPEVAAGPGGVADEGAVVGVGAEDRLAPGRGGEGVDLGVRDRQVEVLADLRRVGVGDPEARAEPPGVGAGRPDGAARAVDPGDQGVVDPARPRARRGGSSRRAARAGRRSSPRSARPRPGCRSRWRRRRRSRAGRRPGAGGRRGRSRIRGSSPDRRPPCGRRGSGRARPAGGCGSACPRSWGRRSASSGSQTRGRWASSSRPGSTSRRPSRRCRPRSRRCCPSRGSWRRSRPSSARGGERRAGGG